MAVIDKDIVIATSDDIDKLNEDLVNKLDNSTDVANAGKAVVVGEDGTLEFGDVVSTVSNPNLLDNAWFNVNSRGQSEYDGIVYTVDRWKQNYPTATTQIDNDGIILKSGLIWLIQNIDNVDIVGKTCTVSVKTADDEIVSKVFTFPTEASGNAQMLIFDNVYLGARIDSDGSPQVRFVNYASSSEDIKIKAVKLEIGNISTLHLDSEPNPEEEKLRCMLSTADPDDTFANKKMQSAVGDEWDRDVIYKPDEMFIAGNTLWKTKVQHSGQIPTEGTYVEKTSVVKELQAIWNAINS